MTLRNKIIKNFMKFCSPCCRGLGSSKYSMRPSLHIISCNNISFTWINQMRIKMTLSIAIPFVFSWITLLNTFGPMLWMLSIWYCSRSKKSYISLIISKNIIEHSSYFSSHKLNNFLYWIELSQLFFDDYSNFRVKKRPCKTKVSNHFYFLVKVFICLIKHRSMMSISHNMLDSLPILYINQFFSKI